MLDLSKCCIFVSLWSALALPVSAQGAEMDDLDPVVLEALHAQLESEDLVRVLVRLAPPEGTSQISGEHQLSAIKSFLQTALPLDDAPLVESVEDQPLMVMEVTRRGLEWLENSPIVAAIRPDGLIAIPPEIESGGEDDSPSFGGNGTGELSAPQSE